jgi:two-component system, NtrC family, sensor kinase
MSNITPMPRTFRVLVIDDTVGIHEDIKKILTPPKTKSDLRALEEAVLSEVSPPDAPMSHFEIDSAFQGEEGVQRVLQARADGHPYALAFLDMRMPPGIDGRETLARLWEIDSELQVVICTAYSDYSWSAIAATTGPTTRVVILRKPFDPIEVMQLAHALTEKWRLEQQTRRLVAQLELLLAERTQELSDSHAVFQLIVEETAQRQQKRTKVAK